MIFFGSGGHTTEMLLLLKNFNFKQYNTVYFIKNDSDTTSKIQVEKFLEEHKVKIDNQLQIQWIDIPRSRKVKQSYVSSLFTTLYSLIYLFVLQLKIKQISLLILNGPGSCVPLVVNQKIIDLLFIVFNEGDFCKIFFFESWCRVDNLSLTGKILYFIVDKFIVHWKQLADKYKRCQYKGQLI